MRASARQPSDAVRLRIALPEDNETSRPENFAKIRAFGVQRLARFVGYRHHKKRFKHGWYELVHQSPDQMGLLSLNGIVVAPRASRPWREKPNATR